MSRRLLGGEANKAYQTLRPAYNNTGIITLGGVKLSYNGGRFSNCRGLAALPYRGKFRRQVFPPDALNLEVEKSLRRLEWSPETLLSNVDKEKLSYKDEKPHLSLLIANYLRIIQPLLAGGYSISDHDDPEISRLDRALLEVFDNKSLRLLARQNFSPGDVMVWAWVLSAPSFTSMMRYTCFERSIMGSSPPRRGIPFTVLAAFARRHDIWPTSLAMSLERSREILMINSTLDGTLGKPSDPNADFHSKKWRRGRDHSSVMILVVQLMRTARKVAPHTLLTIAQMFTYIINHDARTRDSNQLRGRKLRNLIEAYNVCLSFLSLPCSVNPYHSIHNQERAAFHLVEEMSKFQPPLLLNRMGYEALTRILLARRKTPVEKRWADLKSNTWPPWKEDKLGIDEDRGMEGSLSKAARLMDLMKSSGYDHQATEIRAKILAGWDTDGTPTIQTRTIINPDRQSWLKNSTLDESRSTDAAENDPDGWEADPSIWAARIRATRTLREAWASYLSCQDRGIIPNEDIYFEILEKLIYHHSPTKPWSNSTSVPGDGKEVLSDPTSPRDIIYVHTEPPTLHEFLDELLLKDIQLTPKLLHLLLTRAWSFEIGMECLFKSSLSVELKNALVYGCYGAGEERAALLRCVPNKIFAAFIKFLCKFGFHRDFKSGATLSKAFPIVYNFTPWDEHAMAPYTIVSKPWVLFHAVSLLQLRRPYYIPGWLALLSALCNQRFPSTAQYSRGIQDVLAYKEVHEVVLFMQENSIEPGMKAFQIYCQALGRFLFTVFAFKADAERGWWMIYHGFNSAFGSRPVVDILDAAQDGVDFAKRLFYQSVLPPGTWSGGQIQRDSVPLPALLSIPAPAELHAFMRVLGLAEDYKGIITLLRWIATFESDLEMDIEPRMGGRTLFRRAIVASRVFLERVYISSTTGDVEDTYIDQAREIIEGSKLMSPWPTDEEMTDYMPWHKRHN